MHCSSVVIVVCSNRKIDFLANTELMLQTTLFTPTLGHIALSCIAWMSVCL